MKDLKLQLVYDSETSSIVNDLISPLLKETATYYRGVGYFSSGWLKVASNGLAALVKSGGKANIIASPHITENDLKAINDGLNAKNDEVLKFILSKQVDDLQESLETDSLNALSWMVADNIIEFKVAIPRNYNSVGMYHDKVGVFIDNLGDYVVVHGSLNDSVQGTENGEAYSVFKSWESSHREFAEMHKARLLKLWKGENKQFHACSMPDAIRDKLISFRNDERPYSLAKSKIVKEKNIEAPYSLYNYQESAIANWEENSCCGLFDMATGTGKTFTALNCALSLYLKLGKLLTIVSVPYTHLMEQWANNISEFNFKVLKVDTAKSDWHIRLKMVVQDFAINAFDNLFIVAVHDSCSGVKFQRVIDSINMEYALFIADEVHGLGAAQYRKALNDKFKYRLGLSATPKRWFDEVGTSFIFDYFSKVVFSYGLEEAINNNFLTKYDYIPTLVQLDDDEQEEYDNLSKAIQSIKNIAKGSRTENSSSGDVKHQLEYYYRERAKIILNAKNKINKLLSSLQQLISLGGLENIKHVLIYCPPGGHKDVLFKVAQLGLRCHEFVHTVSSKDRLDVLEKFGSGSIQVLIAVRCLDEGVDVPATKIAYILASSSNPKEFIQRRGRVLRKSPGKNKSIIHDYIVIPNNLNTSSGTLKDKSIIQREFPRFAEFANLASNKYDARKTVRALLEQCGMLEYIDKLPWEVYHEIKDQLELS